MTASVSTLARSSGATSPSREMNLSMIFFLRQRTHIDKMTGNCSGGGHRRAHEMRASTSTLAPLEIAIGSRRAALAWRQLVLVHAEAHRATRLTPFETRCNENLVEPFLFSLTFHQPGTRHHH